MKKKSIVLSAVFIILMGLFFSCTYRRHHHNISVSISESSDTYRLRAEYDENNTWRVQRYINRQLEPNGLFASTEDHFDVTTELKDRTRFYIKAEPGSLLIKINKHENSYESYMRIKTMCRGIAGVLKEKND